ncbi:hemolysin III family protein [uncultured Sunxiuqinia sp.]|uniref:PAQR family membrane homeostasis protein TrhA n=1 Tax=uncultured Sunxiuqinia sp. TaxID=1573825 RepID=UPI0030DA4F6B|tara:strand:- start:94594 stop:95262 length:669 start_codon:yes stop_codon:yes gene_type:complete
MKKVKGKNLIRAEEIANSISHGIGIGLAIAGVTILTVFGALYGNAWHIVSFAVFGASMILLYLASTLFHSAKNPRLKAKLNRVDHSAIYILIAGSYTPISLISLRGWIGWTIFGLIWGMAIAGIVFKMRFYSSKWRNLSAWLYVAMGWLIVVAIVPVIQNVPNTSLWFLLAGGLSYTSGAIFYLFPKVPFFHLVFHLFILGGSICHFFSFLYLLPIQAISNS